MIELIYDKHFVTGLQRPSTCSLPWFECNIPHPHRSMLTSLQLANLATINKVGGLSHLAWA